MDWLQIMISLVFNSSVFLQSSFSLLSLSLSLRRKIWRCFGLCPSTSKARKRLQDFQMLIQNTHTSTHTPTENKPFPSMWTNVTEGDWKGLLNDETHPLTHYISPTHTQSHTQGMTQSRCTWKPYPEWTDVATKHVCVCVCVCVCVSVSYSQSKVCIVWGV